jgi:hypothetical protein
MGEHGVCDFSVFRSRKLLLVIFAISISKSQKKDKRISIIDTTTLFRQLVYMCTSSTSPPFDLVLKVFARLLVKGLYR